MMIIVYERPPEGSVYEYFMERFGQKEKKRKKWPPVIGQPRAAAVVKKTNKQTKKKQKTVRKNQVRQTRRTTSSTAADQRSNDPDWSASTADGGPPFWFVWFFFLLRAVPCEPKENKKTKQTNRQIFVLIGRPAAPLSTNQVSPRHGHGMAEAKIKDRPKRSDRVANKVPFTFFYRILFYLIFFCFFICYFEKRKKRRATVQNLSSPEAVDIDRIVSHGNANDQSPFQPIKK